MSAMERVTIEMHSKTADALRQAVTRDGYESAGQLVEYALREWFNIQSSETRKIESLRAAIAEGEKSGPGIPAEQVFAEIEELIATHEKPSEAA